MGSASRRTSPPFRADHVGSLLRPRRLLQAREDFAAGRIAAEDLRAVEDEVTRAVRMQEEVGLQSATDGVAHRFDWTTASLRRSARACALSWA
jgi:5-methyltetrahydropteroyltriglutamate--homocysteine methyltransferase